MAKTMGGRQQGQIDLQTNKGPKEVDYAAHSGIKLRKNGQNPNKKKFC